MHSYCVYELAKDQAMLCLAPAGAGMFFNNALSASTQTLATSEATDSNLTSSYLRTVSKWAFEYGRSRNCVLTLGRPMSSLLACRSRSRNQAPGHTAHAVRSKYRRTERLLSSVYRAKPLRAHSA